MPALDAVEAKAAVETAASPSTCSATSPAQEIELLAFDCFRIYPHYHYGPRYKNERIYLDKTLVPDPFKWALDQFKTGKLPAMLTRAGYPTVAAALDEGLVAGKLTEVEARGLAMRQA